MQIENGETAVLYFDGGGSSSATVTKILSDPIFTTVQSSGAATLNSATVTNNLTVSGNIVVTGTVDGRDLSGDGAKLDQIEAEAEKNQTTTEIFTAIKGLDGTGSGLDADLLDGQQGSYYQPASTAITKRIFHLSLWLLLQLPQLQHLRLQPRQPLAPQAPPMQLARQC